MKLVLDPRLASTVLALLLLLSSVGGHCGFDDSNDEFWLHVLFAPDPPFSGVKTFLEGDLGLGRSDNDSLKLEGLRPNRRPAPWRSWPALARCLASREGLPEEQLQNWLQNRTRGGIRKALQEDPIVTRDLNSIRQALTQLTVFQNPPTQWTLLHLKNQGSPSREIHLRELQHLKELTRTLSAQLAKSILVETVSLKDLNLTLVDHLSYEQIHHYRDRHEHPLLALAGEAALRSAPFCEVSRNPQTCLAYHNYYYGVKPIVLEDGNFDEIVRESIQSRGLDFQFSEQMARIQALQWLQLGIERFPDFLMEFCKDRHFNQTGLFPIFESLLESQQPDKRFERLSFNSDHSKTLAYLYFSQGSDYLTIRDRKAKELGRPELFAHFLQMAKKGLPSLSGAPQPWKWSSLLSKVFAPSGWPVANNQAQPENTPREILEKGTNVIFEIQTKQPLQRLPTEMHLPTLERARISALHPFRSADSSEFYLISGDPANVTNRAMTLPHVFGFRVSEVQILAADGARMFKPERDYIVLDNPESGEAYIRFSRRLFSAKSFHVEVGYRRTSPFVELPDPELDVLKTENLQPLVEKLRDAYLFKLADGIESLLTRAPVRTERIAELFKMRTRYSFDERYGYGAIPAAKGPFAPFSGFLNEKNELCFQSDGSASLWALFLRLYFADQPDVVVEQASYLRRPAADWQILGKDGSAKVHLYRNLELKRVYDTSSSIEEVLPIAPEIQSEAEILDEQLEAFAEDVLALRDRLEKEPQAKRFLRQNKDPSHGLPTLLTLASTAAELARMARDEPHAWLQQQLHFLEQERLQTMERVALLYAPSTRSQVQLANESALYRDPGVVAGIDALSSKLEKLGKLLSRVTSSELRAPAAELISWQEKAVSANDILGFLLANRSKLRSLRYRHALQKTLQEGLEKGVIRTFPQLESSKRLTVLLNSLKLPAELEVLVLLWLKEQGVSFKNHSGGEWRKEAPITARISSRLAKVTDENIRSLVSLHVGGKTKALEAFLNAGASEITRLPLTPHQFTELLHYYRNEYATHHAQRAFAEFEITCRFYASPFWRQALPGQQMRLSELQRVASHLQSPRHWLQAKEWLSGQTRKGTEYQQQRYRELLQYFTQVVETRSNVKPVQIEDTGLKGQIKAAGFCRRLFWKVLRNHDYEE